MLAALAAAAVLGSGVPDWLRWPMTLVALLHGWVVAVREAGRLRRRFVLPGAAGTPRVDGREVSDLRLSRRGPLTVVAWREPGRFWQYRCFWPDTLSRLARRELTLAAGDWRVSRSRRSMAP